MNRQLQSREPGRAMTKKRKAELRAVAASQVVASGELALTEALDYIDELEAVLIRGAAVKYTRAIKDTIDLLLGGA
jgi:hypothetical protein